MVAPRWLSAREPLSPRLRQPLGAIGLGMVVLVWCLVSYVPGLWSDRVRVEDPGSASGWEVGRIVERPEFERERERALRAGSRPPAGVYLTPVFLPAPHDVVIAFFRAFTTPPRRPGEPWLHESLLHSIRVIFWGFFLSSLVGVPLGILAGTYGWFRALWEPFLEFFRYLPAPAFGALMVAIFGINDEPKIAIIFIGTFFQQVLVLANTTANLDRTLLEAARTLGCRGLNLLFRVVVPGVLPDLYRDQRILLGWAWTYLIVAEVVGTSSGITWFIYQQARYRQYDNVYAAILMIGIIGLTSDFLLARLGERLFPWKNEGGKT